MKDLLTHKISKFGSIEKISTVVCIISLALWCGLFFPLIYPQIRINTEYLDAECTILSVKKEAYVCCYKSCSYCGLCGANPSCTSMLLSNTPGPCCDGYSCCDNCCDTCKSCGKDGCTSYSCNCRCCTSTIDLACTIYCDTCWRVRVTLTYTCEVSSSCCDTTQSTQKIKDCGRDQGCADQYIQKPYLEVNGTATCYFDPTRCGEVEFEKGYTWWYFLIWGFPTLAIVMLLNYWSFVGFNTWLDNTIKAFIGYLSVWWVILFPLVFLLPIAVATKDEQVDPTSKTAVLAVAFIIMAIALGIISYALYTSGNKTCVYLFTGKKEGSNKFAMEPVNVNVNREVDIPIQLPQSTIIAPTQQVYSEPTIVAGAGAGAGFGVVGGVGVEVGGGVGVGVEVKVGTGEAETPSGSSSGSSTSKSEESGSGKETKKIEGQTEKVSASESEEKSD